MKTIRSRLILIGILVVLSIAALVPRGQKIRVPDPATGRMRDTTITRVPIKYGLDLVGGTHLALEVDQSKGPVADPAEAIRRAERVVRTRIDEFGTTEPVVQIVGGNRLIVQLPEEKDPARAKSIVQRTAFLEFRITDMRNLFRDALPAIDRVLRVAGVGGNAAPAAGGGAAGGLGAGLVWFAGGELVPGAPWVFERIGFDAALAAADVVITSEGRFDRTSLVGKATGEVLRRAQAVGRRAVVLAGATEGVPDAPVVAAKGLVDPVALAALAERAVREVLGLSPS